MCFITNKLDILPPDVIVQLCTSTFSDSDIEVSKKKLFDLCADETNSRYRKRQGAKKSAMNIEDVVKLLQEKGSDVPKFVALDLSKLPPITFDSVYISTLLNTIKKTQNEVDILRATIESHNAVSNGLHSVSASLETRMSCMEKKMDDLSQGIADTSTLAGSSNTAPVIAQVQASVSSSGGSDSLSSGDVSAMTVKTFAQAAGGGGGTDAKTTVSKVNEKQTWVKQVHINGRLTLPRGAVEQIQGREKKLQKGVIGKAQNSGLRTVQKIFRQRRANVFATRFDPAVSSEQVKAYLKKCLNLDATVEAVQTRFDTYASFHITCECPDPSVFMSDDLWLEESVVRWWREPNT